MITTRNGSLAITLDEKNIHGLDYAGGLLTSWNKLCFTGGYIEGMTILPSQRKVKFDG